MMIPIGLRLGPNPSVAHARPLAKIDARRGA